MMQTIEIDLEVYKLIEFNRLRFDESQNDILKRILNLVTREGHISRADFSVRNAAVDYLAEKEQAKDIPFPKLFYMQEKISDAFKSSLHNKLANNQISFDRGWRHGVVYLPENTKLRKLYNGKLYYAEIHDGNIIYDGKKYRNVSTAAMEITGGMNVNGWKFWEYFDEAENDWKKLDFLRK